jgi:hypothetical protein
MLCRWMLGVGAPDEWWHCAPGLRRGFATIGTTPALGVGSITCILRKQGHCRALPDPGWDLCCAQATEAAP